MTQAQLTAKALTLKAEGKTEKAIRTALFNTKGARLSQIRIAMAAVEA